MKITTDILKVALEWVEKNWHEVEGYNLTMTKVTQSRAPIWAEQLIKDVADLKEFVVEQKKFNTKVETFIEEQKAFNTQVFEFMKRTDSRLEKIEQDIVVIKKDIVEIKIRLDNIENCPTIKKELTQLKK